ncbi:MAG TPA: serine/threonine-protein kinase, partial [Gaiellaceae bacterium]|nr:serine/threonine-protein kinase [Gaiellaceae bacterium]
MGEVYRATDSVLERPVAVKLLAEHYAREPESRARFQREALAAARLSRERHVVTVFDVGEHYGRPLIVMEYVGGGSVHDRLSLGSVSREQALDWLEQVGQALDRAHESGIVHRDVKPSNLLLDSEGNIRVSDFGIASAAGLETVTLPGTVLGTAGYISPEQAGGEPATPASDRYSLGVIAFELLTGRRPFEGDTPATQAFAHVNASVPSAERLDSTLPRGIDDVLARALAKDPGDRPGSCAELVGQLR